MINKSMNKPYFYKIKNKITNKYYVGSQYGKNANKDNFFKTYFTSSQSIHEAIKTEGIETFEIISLVERNDAREYEAYYLQKCYSLLGKDKFLNLFYNRSLSPGILLDDKIIAKQTATKKSKWTNGSISKPVPPNWKGKKRSDQMKRRLSESKMGHEVTAETKQKLRKANLGKKQSADTKSKRAQSLANNKNAYGKKHWLFISPDGLYYYTVGKRNKRLHDLNLSEGPGFINYVNTGNTPSQGKNVGWIFFEGQDQIEQTLNTIPEEKIVRYEN
jgi:hypothetical protein